MIQYIETKKKAQKFKENKTETNKQTNKNNSEQLCLKFISFHVFPLP